MIKFPTNSPSGPVIIHTDSVNTFPLVPGRHDRQSFLRAHLTVIEKLLSGRHAWFPSFNYDFLGSRVFDVDEDRCQVGSINEFVRLNEAEWRTPTPVFNFTGSGPRPAHVSQGDPALIYPFDDDSTFAQCVREDGIVLWYGAPFSSATILHHAESMSNGPLYRYDKDFSGKVISGGISTDVVLRYHVRPLGRPVDYDWARIVSDARSQGIIRQIDEKTSVYWAPAHALVEYWVEKQLKDPLYLLDADSRSWIALKLESLGRRFELGDFEDVAA